MTFPNLERWRVWPGMESPPEPTDPVLHLAQEAPIPDLNALVVFAKVVEANSFSEAARATANADLDGEPPYCRTRRRIGRAPVGSLHPQSAPDRTWGRGTGAGRPQRPVE